MVLQNFGETGKLGHIVDHMKSLQSEALLSEGLNWGLLSISINLLAFYHECRSPIGYATHYLF